MTEKRLFAILLAGRNVLPETFKVGICFVPSFLTLKTLKINFKEKKNTFD